MALEEFGVGVHQAFRLIDAGIVDQTVQSAQGFGDFNRGIPIGFFRDVLMHVGRGAFQFLGQSAAGVVEQVADDDAGALGHATTGLGRTLAAGAAADQDDFSVETGHGCLLLSARTLFSLRGTTGNSPERRRSGR